MLLFMFRIVRFGMRWMRGSLRLELFRMHGNVRGGLSRLLFTTMFDVYFGLFVGVLGRLWNLLFLF